MDRVASCFIYDSVDQHLTSTCKWIESLFKEAVRCRVVYISTFVSFESILNTFLKIGLQVTDMHIHESFEYTPMQSFFKWKGPCCSLSAASLSEHTRLNYTVNSVHMYFIFEFGSFFSTPFSLAQICDLFYDLRQSGAAFGFRSESIRFCFDSKLLSPLELSYLLTALDSYCINDTFLVNSVASHLKIPSNFSLNSFGSIINPMLTQLVSSLAAQIATLEAGRQELITKLEIKEAHNTSFEDALAQSVGVNVLSAGLSRSTTDTTSARQRTSASSMLPDPRACQSLATLHKTGSWLISDNEFSVQLDAGPLGRMLDSCPMSSARGSSAHGSSAHDDVLHQSEELTASSSRQEIFRCSQSRKKAFQLAWCSERSSSKRPDGQGSALEPTAPASAQCAEADKETLLSKDALEAQCPSAEHLVMQEKCVTVDLSTQAEHKTFEVQVQNATDGSSRKEPEQGASHAEVSVVAARPRRRSKYDDPSRFIFDDDGSPQSRSGSELSTSMDAAMDTLTTRLKSSARRSDRSTKSDSPSTVVQNTHVSSQQQLSTRPDAHYDGPEKDSRDPQALAGANPSETTKSSSDLRFFQKDPPAREKPSEVVAESRTAIASSAGATTGAVGAAGEPPPPQKADGSASVLTSRGLLQTSAQGSLRFFGTKTPPSIRRTSAQSASETKAPDDRPRTDTATADEPAKVAEAVQDGIQQSGISSVSVTHSSVLPKESSASDLQVSQKALFTSKRGLLFMNTVPTGLAPLPAVSPAAPSATHGEEGPPHAITRTPAANEGLPPGGVSAQRLPEVRSRGLLNTAVYQPQRSTGRLDARDATPSAPSFSTEHGVFVPEISAHDPDYFASSDGHEGAPTGVGGAQPSRSIVPRAMAARKAGLRIMIADPLSSPLSGDKTTDARTSEHSGGSSLLGTHHAPSSSPMAQSRSASEEVSSVESHGEIPSSSRSSSSGNERSTRIGLSQVLGVEEQDPAVAPHHADSAATHVHSSKPRGDVSLEQTTPGMTGEGRGAGSTQPLLSIHTVHVSEGKVLNVAGRTISPLVSKPWQQRSISLPESELQKTVGPSGHIATPGHNISGCVVRTGDSEIVTITKTNPVRNSIYGGNN